MTVPDWLRPVIAAQSRTQQFRRYSLPPGATARPSAVLLLFGESDGAPDVLLTERASGLRSHAGQVSFPGGAIDPDDDGPAAAALREAAEETGLEPAGVHVLGTLPTQWIPVTNYAVTPVLAWWREPSPVRVVDPAEVASVHRIRLDDLLDPANRFQIRHPSGMIGPAFQVGALLVWGFTAGVLARLFKVAGMDKPWDRTRIHPDVALVRQRRGEQ
ncbi:CoA pyrophosphatase [Phytoactinopolyspora alkaliphila]|uniref:CoA pyrophosphatase n=1 Tax=Phytoactinopolyspora alkaliphila TaxID=1783498 RepID=A0A6N9YLL1_9ACTN|nr:CoA pyrophosphatase [Phytoactinopolyspora alkaliphila]NED95810.1 CoA pyrophosphatase [Phytoactinopolyspora alkaliphila]